MYSFFLSLKLCKSRVSRLIYILIQKSTTRINLNVEKCRQADEFCFFFTCIFRVSMEYDTVEDSVLTIIIMARLGSAFE